MAPSCLLQTNDVDTIYACSSRCLNEFHHVPTIVSVGGFVVVAFRIASGGRDRAEANMRLSQEFISLSADKNAEISRRAIFSLGPSVLRNREPRLKRTLY